MGLSIHFTENHVYSDKFYDDMQNYNSAMPSSVQSSDKCVFTHMWLKFDIYNPFWDSGHYGRYPYIPEEKKRKKSDTLLITVDRRWLGIAVESASIIS